LQALRIPAGVADTTNWNVVASDIKDSGNPADALEATDIKINKAGNVEATVVINGESRTITIGKVAVMTFQNQEGLSKDGSNYYKTSKNDNTGICSAGAPGSNRASLMPGYLEASNVDMAVEFSEMIMAERGFQANSKIITVSDEILSDLINMKR